MPRPKPAELQAPLGFRVPVGLIERVDAYCEAMQRRTGLRVSRSDAIRVLLEKALTVEGFGAEPAAKPKRGK